MMNKQALLSALWKEQGKVAKLRLHAEADGSSNFAYYEGMFDGLAFALKMIEKLGKGDDHE